MTCFFPSPSRRPLLVFAEETEPETVGIIGTISSLIFLALNSNSQRSRSLRAHPHMRVTLIMVGLSTTEAAIKIKQFKGRKKSFLKVSVKFLSAIMGPEMGASILWTPGKMRSFCKEKTHVLKIPRLRGGIFGFFFWGGGECRFYFYGRADCSDI